jgi:hypothetical protein
MLGGGLGMFGGAMADDAVAAGEGDLGDFGGGDFGGFGGGDFGGGGDF